MSEKDVPLEIFYGINYFITGSVRFGTQKPNSDLDIAICINNAEHIKDKLEVTFKKKIKPSDYNNGFKFEHEAHTINIVPLHPLDYVAWYHAAKIMEILPNKKDKTRTELHGIHETLCGFIKLYFSNKCINLNNYLSFCK